LGDLRNFRNRWISVISPTKEDVARTGILSGDAHFVRRRPESRLALKRFVSLNDFKSTNTVKDYREEQIISRKTWRLKTIEFKAEK